MLDTPFRSAMALARDIKAQRITSRALLELFLARIDRHNPALNAVITQQREHARALADAADAALARDATLGPLHGVPITVKESYNIAGLPTTWGVVAMRNNIASSNALSVQRLIDAGAIVLGKTNVPEMLADFQSYNEIYGTTNNPWDLGRTPGGSSGGSAAALAAGFSALEMGSDIGGSIRNPAHFCGVFGHKPTWNLVPAHGHSLADVRVPTDIAAVGPLARSAGDLELAMRLIAAPDELDRAGVSYRLAPLSKPVGALRIAVWHTDPLCPSSADVAARVEAVASALAKAGAHVDANARPDFTAQETHNTMQNLLGAAMAARTPAADFADLVARADNLAPNDASPGAVTLRAQTMRVRDWAANNDARARLRWAWHAFFKDYDFLITPIMPTSAFPHDHRNFGARSINIDGKEFPYFTQLFWAGLAGLSYLPATIIPTGTDAKGLPIGVQIVGPAWGDLQTIQLAQHLERMGFAFAPPPEFA